MLCCAMLAHLVCNGSFHKTLILVIYLLIICHLYLAGGIRPCAISTRDDADELRIEIIVMVFEAAPGRGPGAPGAKHQVQQLPEAAGNETAEPQKQKQLGMKMRPVLTHQCAEGRRADPPGCPA